MDKIKDLPQKSKEQLEILREYLKSLEKVCIAYSGGVDSSLVAFIAQEQLGHNALAITGVSPSLAPYLRLEAKQQADWIGIRHLECKTNELENPEYQKNPKNRCFACKQELHIQLAAIAKEAEGAQVVDGVNHDDLMDYRPGIQAAIKAGVKSPLAELKIDKATVRQISQAIGLPWWNKPAQPCLASRFPYGEKINSDRLNKIAKAETWLKNKGYEVVRVRMYGDSAKIEVPIERIEEFVIDKNRKLLLEFFFSIGFNSVSIDLEGIVKGKLNRVLKAY